MLNKSIFSINSSQNSGSSVDSNVFKSFKIAMCFNPQEFSKISIDDMVDTIPIIIRIKTVIFLFFGNVNLYCRNISLLSIL